MLKKVEEVESQLVRINLEYCKKKKCSICPVNRICGRVLVRYNPELKRITKKELVFLCRRGWRR